MFTREPFLIPSYFDELWNNKKEKTFPATDIYSVDGKTVIEMALAGYGKDQVSIKVEEGYLIIEGIKDNSSEGIDTETRKQYHKKEIAKRYFTSKYKLVKDIDEVNAEFDNGILRIELKTKMDEIKQIPINFK